MRPQSARGRRPYGGDAQQLAGERETSATNRPKSRNWFTFEQPLELRLVMGIYLDARREVRNESMQFPS